MNTKTLALYLGCKVHLTTGSGWSNWSLLNSVDLRDNTVVIGDELVSLDDPYATIKLLLRPLLSMTEEDFRLFAEDFFNSKNLVFASQDKYWYACERELDPDYEGTPMEYINDAGDDDAENVLMCSTISKLITYGWLIYEESYNGFSMREQAEVIRYFTSKGFDLFGLIESGHALDSTSQPEGSTVS